jgi:D-3-phosphoglycerate dehydrogenase
MTKMALHVLHIEAEGFSADARSEIKKFAALDEHVATRAQLLSLVPLCDVLWVRLGHSVDEEVFEQAVNLKAVVTATTGLNHIDLDAATRRGIDVLCLKGERAFLDTVAATAEHTWGLLLALVRHLPWSFDSVRNGDWLRDEFAGSDLRGRTIGIVGLGRLGTMVAEYARVFGMRVVAADPFAQQLPEWISVGPLAEVLADADIVSIHVPLTANTKGMFGERELRQMRTGSYLVNTSRGELVDEDALLAALESRHLAGAAVDVVSHERQGRHTMATHPLIAYAMRSDNLLITPHVGGATIDAMARTEKFMAEKLCEWAMKRMR